MLLAGLETRAVPIAVLAVGHRGVVLLEAGINFVVQGVFQRFGMSHGALAKRVFLPKIRQHIRIAALVVSQPVIGVYPLAKWRFDPVRPHGGNGSLGLRIVHCFGLSWYEARV